MNTITNSQDSNKKADKEYRDAYLGGTVVAPLAILAIMYLFFNGPWLTTSKIPGFLMIAAGLLSSTIGCYYWARLKGLPRWLMLVGLLPVVGWLVLAFIPDRRASG